MEPIVLCQKRESIVTANGHLLIEGGPGSGKTTVALLKAQRIIANSTLLANQKILFLSFARATIARVQEHAKTLIEKDISKKIEINTYHGFTWALIQNYGYLVSLKKSIKLVTPPIASAMMATIPVSERDVFRKDLYLTDGLLCFDNFASVGCEILTRSTKIRENLSDVYPIIIVDEFQDTNSTEWELIKHLGRRSKIIALADLQQRIYDFRGASITRLPEFNLHFRCTKFDLGKDNHRSGNTDIAIYGDDLLTGRNIGKTYQDVVVNRYKRNYRDNYAPLKYEVINSIKRQKKRHPDNKWSIAILVKSKQTTLLVSSALSKPSSGLPSVYHEVLIDPSGPALAATVISCLLEPFSSIEECTIKLIRGLINHVKGRKNDGASLADLKLTNALEIFLEDQKISGKNRVLLVKEVGEIVKKRSAMIFKGAPIEDWLTIRKLFETSTHENLKNVYSDAIFLRLLNKGAILNEELSEKWRNFQCYQDAKTTVETALLQEHFSMASRVWQGIFVMTIHKSKGKEFDEVIIWEDQYHAILPPNAAVVDIERTKLALRVAVTRAKNRTCILTCQDRSCSLV
jgi:DNA helicase II / ATP-dependent DNA helicase PcrA